jgi:hypothetical protein
MYTKKTLNALSIIVMLIFSLNIFAIEWDNKIQILKTVPVKSTVSMRDFLISKGQKANFDNKVTLVILEDGTKAVFKPVPQNDLGDAHAEVAAFKASQWLGFPEIPPTIIRKIKNEIGSLQLYVEPTLDSLQLGVYEEVLKKVSSESLANLKLFYFIFGQWDTGPQNLIIRKELDGVHLVAIDNGGIKNRQYVRYGELPFVRICYSDVLKTKDWHLPFPYEKVKIINNTSFETLSEILGNKFPKKILENLSRYTAPLPYAIYKNSLWIQFHKSDPAFVMSHTTVYPKKTIDTLKRLNKKELDKIFSEAQGLDFLTKDYIESILERRDQVMKAYESVNDKKTSM